MAEVKINNINNEQIAEKSTPAVDPVKNNSDEEPDCRNIVTNLEKQIIRQVEYYFSDSNLWRDKYLQDQIQKDEGWVPFEVLLKFKRLASLSESVNDIVTALEKSSEGLIEISEDKTKIRRHPERPVPEQNEEHRKEVCSRTAYVKGFPLDVQMSELIDFFSSYQKVLNIIMRKYHEKSSKTYKFKGSIFVTFSKQEECEKFIGSDRIEYENVPLIRKWQQDYIDEKILERSKTTKKNKVHNEKAFELPKGTVLFFEGNGQELSLSREQIKEALEASDGAVKYIGYNKGDKNGYVRLENEGSAKELIERLPNKKLLIENIELNFRVLTAEEEKEYLEKAIELMRVKRNNQKKHKNSRGNRKRQLSESSEGGPKSKR